MWTADPARRRAAARGLLTGWALGAWEAALVLAENAGLLADPVSAIGIPLAPILLYGWGGLTLGATPWGPRLPWSWLFPLGAALLLKPHLSTGLLQHPMLGLAVALGAGVLWWRTRHPSEVVARRLVRAGAATLALPLLAWLGLWAAGTRADAAARAALAAPAALAPPPPAEAPNVVLVTWDTVRADTLPPWGGRGLDTPALQRLADEGVLFEKAQAVASITGPAHMSMLTGLYPPSHGLRSNGETAPVLPLPRLPEIFAAAGYATGAFVSAYSVRGDFGFDRGFHVFRDRPMPRALQRLLFLAALGSEFADRLLPDTLLPDTLTVPGDVTLSRATEWYAATARPAFLWAHFYDAHHPYLPTEPQRSRALARADEGPAPFAPECREDVALQRAEIEMLDAWLARLRAELERKDPGLRRTVIVLLADHGECFGEGGFINEHQPSLYAATQHVPWIVRPAGAAGADDDPAAAVRGRRVAAPVSQVDLLPTLCSSAGLEPPPGMQGQDLAPWFTGGGDPARGLYMEAYSSALRGRRLVGWYADGWKYVRALDGDEHLYGPEGGDAEDRIALDPARAAALRAALEAALEGLPLAEAVERNLTDEDRRALQELGYAGD